MSNQPLASPDSPCLSIWPFIGRISLYVLNYKSNYRGFTRSERAIDEDWLKMKESIVADVIELVDEDEFAYPDREVIVTPCSDLISRHSYLELCGKLTAAVEQDSPAAPDLIDLNEAVAILEAQRRIGRVRSFPRHVSIAITDVCNARCTFCNYTPERVSMQTVSPESLARADWLRFSRTLALTAGLGDSFAHPQIDEILNLLREKYPYLQLRFITNASLLRESNIQTLVGYAEGINISLNAARKETYEQTMAPLKWDKTIANLRTLRDAKRASNTKKPRLIASYVLHASNIDELPELPALLADLDIPIARINFMVPPAQNSSRTLMTERDSIHRVPDLAGRRLREFQDACLEHGIVLDRPLAKFVSSENDAEAAGIASAPTSATQNSWAMSGGPAGRKRPFADLISKSVGRDVASSDVSSEFVKLAAQNKPIVCNKPWELLSIDLMRRTHVCCSFFTHLPQFEWVGAKEFHNGMWNHAFMQFMREGMGTEAEIPFCTFCKAKNKRDPIHADERKVVADQSLSLYQSVLAKSDGIVKKGRIDRLSISGGARKMLPVSVSDWIVNHQRTRVGKLGKKFSVKVLNAFGIGDVRDTMLNKQKDQLRRFIRSRGLRGLKNVATVGAPKTWLPFLAEINGHLQILVDEEADVGVISTMMRRCELDNYNVDVIKKIIPFPADDGTLDAIVVGAGTIEVCEREALFVEFRRAMSERGFVSVNGYSSIGALTQRVLRSSGSTRGGERDKIVEILRRGPNWGGSGNFGMMAQIDVLPGRSGLMIDKVERPAANRIGGAKAAPHAELSNISALASRLEDDGWVETAVRDNTLVHGLELNLVFRLIEGVEIKSRVLSH